MHFFLFGCRVFQLAFFYCEHKMAELEKELYIEQAKINKLNGIDLNKIDLKYVWPWAKISSQISI